MSEATDSVVESMSDFEAASASTAPPPSKPRQRIYFGQGQISKGRFVITFHDTETHGQGRHKVVTMGRRVDMIDRFNRKNAVTFQTWVTDPQGLQQFCAETLLHPYDGDFPKLVDEEFLEDLLQDFEISTYRAFDGQKVNEFVFKRQRGVVLDPPKDSSDPDEGDSLSAKFRRTIYYAEVVTDDELGEYEILFENENGDDKGMFELFDADPAFIEFCHATLVHPPPAGRLEEMKIDFSNLRQMNKFLRGKALDGEKVEALMESRAEFDEKVQGIIDRRSFLGAKPKDQLVPTIYGVRRRYGK